MSDPATPPWSPPAGAVGRARDRMGRRRLGEIAVARGLVTQARIDEALAEQAARKARGDPLPLGRLLIDLGRISQDQLVELLDEQESLDPLRIDAPVAEIAEAERDPERVVGRYVLVEKIGHGGMGIVWKAWDRDLRRWVAFKVLREESPEVARKRFLVEARAAAGLRHPNLVTVFETGEHRGRPYIVMELVDGKPLDVGRPLREAADLIRKAAEGLHVAHRNGVIHRDLKPGNIMVDARGEPRVVDFGLAHLSDDPSARLTKTGVVMGTPLYMAPEQVQGRSDRISPPTDVYALGAILYEFATGRPPHTGLSATEIYSRIVGEEPLPPRSQNDKVPRELEIIILKSLEKDPSRRYSTAEELAADLGRFLQGEPIAARPVSTMGRLWRKGFKHRAVLLPTAAALVLALGWATAAWIGARKDADEQEAYALLERGRAALDDAEIYLYDPAADYEGLRRRVETALPWFDRALKAAPRLPAGHHLQGRAHEILGWADRAEASYRRAIDLDPSHGPSHFRLGRMLVERSFLAVAVTTSEEWKRQAPEAEGLAAEALRAFDAAASSGWGDDLQRELTACVRLYVARDTERLASAVRTAITRFGRRRGVEELHWLATYAVPAAERPGEIALALQIRPRFPLALFSRALLRGQADDHDGVIADLEAALAIAPRFTQARLNLGNAFNRKGLHDRAAAEYTRVLEVDPESGDAYEGRAGARYRLGDRKGSMADLDAAISRRPEFLTYFKRAKLNEELGNLPAAVRDFEECHRLAPADWPARAEIRRKADDLKRSLER